MNNENFLEEIKATILEKLEIIYETQKDLFQEKSCYLKKTQKKEMQEKNALLLLLYQ